MKLLLELSMECESLARAEALAAAEVLGGSPEVVRQEPGVMVIDSEADPGQLAARLGLCHYVSEWLATCESDAVERCAGALDVPGPIRVRSTKIGEKSIDLAGVSRKVGAILGKSRGVDLHSPASDVRVVYSGKAHIGRAIVAIDRASFEKRKNRYMPFVYPASLHPKFARAMVNLTKVRSSGSLLDPFCGTGAVLAEASMVGFKAIGTDISEKMIDGAKRNLVHLGQKAEYALSDVGDIAAVVGHVDGIATDPPYGRSTSTKGEKIRDLYRRAFVAFSDVLDQGSRVVLAVPDVSLIETSERFRMVEKHPLWVHRSLTRNFCVVERLR